jgi:competence protein ComEC
MRSPRNGWLRHLVVIFLVVAWFDSALADRVTPREGVVNHINVRDQRQNGNVIGQLAKGAFAVLLSAEGAHYKVRLDGGVEGYVAKSWSTVVADVHPAAPPSGQLAIHFIDVGQGDSTLIVCPDNSTILVDAGSLSGMPAEPVRDYITEVLGPHVQRIDHLVVTHADQDHYNLLPDVMTDFEIGQVYYVGKEADYYDYFWTWLQDFEEDRRTRFTETYFNAPDEPHSGMDCGSAEIFVLAAAIDHHKSWKNAMSIVLMVKFGSFEAILTGDATHATEDAIMARYQPAFLNVDLLKIGHHGSLETSTSENWANLLKPGVAIASAAERSQYGHPRIEVIQRLTPHTINDTVRAHPFSAATRSQGEYQWTDVAAYEELIYGTAKSGNIMVTTDGTAGFIVTTRAHGTF